MNYIGSKHTLLPFLEECVAEVVGEDKALTFCDLFAGTGIVGRHFKKKGYCVIANDWQYYSFVLNKHYIENGSPLLFGGLVADIPELLNCSDDEKAGLVCRYLDEVPPLKGFIYHNYSINGRLYFTEKNAAKCDAVRTQIEQWMSRKKITCGEYYFLLTTLIENIDRVANTASVYGAFLKKIKKTAEQPLQMRPAEVICSPLQHKVTTQDANAIVSQIQTDVLYLDPPYNARQYAANYHLLETIARYDNPAITGKTGMRNYNGQKSLYCSKKNVVHAFEELIAGANAKYILLSYNNEGLMSFNEIRQIMSKRGEYGFFEREYSRFKADKASETRNIKASSTTEYLHFVKVR